MTLFFSAHVQKKLSPIPFREKKFFFGEYIFWVLWGLKHILNIKIFDTFFFQHTGRRGSPSTKNFLVVCEYIFWVLWGLKHILNIKIFDIFFSSTGRRGSPIFSLLTKKNFFFGEYIFWVLQVLKHILNIISPKQIFFPLNNEI